MNYMETIVRGEEEGLYNKTVAVNKALSFIVLVLSEHFFKNLCNLQIFVSTLAWLLTDFNTLQHFE